MKLIIEDESSRTSCVGQRFKQPVIRANRALVDVNVPRQQLDSWCWAAIAAGLSEYYGTGTPSQADIASGVLDVDCSHFENDEQLKAVANTVARLDKAMALVSCYSHWSAGKPLFDRIKFEINQGRPLAARIEWFSGGAHYVLIHGYADATGNILVADPMHGASEHPLAHFPARYRLGGAWTETFWTRHV